MVRSIILYTYTMGLVTKKLTFCRPRLLHLRVRHRSATSRPHTDTLSPVIIAENMIGCAMYELVCTSLEPLQKCR